jgi:cobalt-zinc-cadmium efflux system outer membrane protein
MRQGFAVGLLALSLPLSARAQGITEGEFLAGVDERHPAVRALQEGLAAAEAARIRAGTLSNPRVEFWREQPEANPRLTNWTVAWTPPLDGRMGPAKKAADAGVAAAREGAAVDRARLRQELRRAFAAWGLASERRALLAAQADLVGRLAESERQRARAGEAAGLSARRLDLSRAEAQAALRDAEAELARAGAAARAWRPDLSTDTRPASPIPPDAPTALSAEGSPELKGLEHQVERSTFEARRAGRFWGFPTLQFGWQRLEDGGVVRDGPILAANWSVPLFDRDKGARVEADRRTEVAKARLELARSRVAAEVEGGLAAYRSLLASAREARQAADESGLVIDAATTSYRAGEATLTDLLDALRTAFAARVRELEIRASALEAHRALEAALGQPLSGGGR